MWDATVTSELLFDHNLDEERKNVQNISILNMFGFRGSIFLD